MVLNKSGGQMYPNTYTINPCGGECTHFCDYCYIKSFKSPPLKKKYRGEIRLIEKELKENLYKYGKGITIFIQSCGDLFAKNIPDDVIHKILIRCNKFDKNTYLFQSKNPKRFKYYFDYFPPKTILGTTIETNRDYDISKAPLPKERYVDFKNISPYNFIKFVSIEPIMDLDYEIMIEWMTEIRPNYISIGADSKNNGLEEPDEQKIIDLVTGLKEFTNVRLKSNLRRLAPSLF